MKRHDRGGGFWGVLEYLLIHATLILSGIFITLWTINLFNWQMEFLTSRVSNRLMIVYFSTALFTSGLYIVRRAGRRFGKNGRARAGDPPKNDSAARKSTQTPSGKAARKPAAIGQNRDPAGGGSANE